MINWFKKLWNRVKEWFLKLWTSIKDWFFPVAFAATVVGGLIVGNVSSNDPILPIPPPPPLPTIDGPYIDQGSTLEIQSTSTVPKLGKQKIVVDKTKPKVTFHKWNDEVAMGVQYQGMNAVGNKPDFFGTVEWKSGQQKMEVIPLDASATVGEDGGMEINIILDSKPVTNVFNFSITGANNLNFFYQPKLWQGEGLKAPTVNCTDTDCIDSRGRTIHRPENVVGSYAVYYKNHKDHQIGKTNYATGKAYHIYRPLVTDSTGTSTWAVMNYNAGILSVIVPQNFLDSAIYPVKVDPTFGYTTLGATADTGNKAATGNPVAHKAIGQYIAATGDTITMFSVGTNCFTACIPTGSMDMAVYSYVSSNPSARLAAAVVVTVTTATKGWWDSSAISQSPSAGTTYVTAMGNYGNGASGMDLYWDAGVASAYGLHNAAGALPASWTDCGCDGNRQYSMYTTYTTSGGAATTPSTDSNGWWKVF